MPKRKRKSVNGNVRVSSSRKSGLFFSTIIPLVLTGLILFCLGFLTMMAYRNLTASSFFEVKDIQIIGAEQVSVSDVERIVRTEMTGKTVWNANLDLIKQQLEKEPMIKSAIVSRRLPDSITVRITERKPKFIARIAESYFWIDEEARILKKATDDQVKDNVILIGLEERDADKNKQRITLADKMYAEFSQAGLLNRIKAFNLSNLYEPKVIVEDSGEIVTIALGRENFGYSLRKALEVLDGRGKEIESIISQGGYPIVRFRKV